MSEKGSSSDGGCFRRTDSVSLVIRTVRFVKSVATVAAVAVEEWSVDQRTTHISVGQTFKTKACNKKRERREKRREGEEREEKRETREERRERREREGRRRREEEK